MSLGPNATAITPTVTTTSPMLNPNGMVFQVCGARAETRTPQPHSVARRETPRNEGRATKWSRNIERDTSVITKS
jgi:hypothetical protein